MKMCFQQYKPSRQQYTLGVAGLVLGLICISTIALFRFNVDWINASDYVMAVKAVGPGLIFAIAFLPKKMLAITKDSKYLTMHTEYRFAFFSIALPKKPLPKIDYVCAFCQLQSDSDNYGNIDYSYIYDVNAWYGNKHIKLCSQYTADEAMQVATKLAIYLQCDLLNATDPNNKEWIEVSCKSDDVQAS